MAAHKIKKGVEESDAFMCSICEIYYDKNFQSDEICVCKACKLAEKKTDGIREPKVFVVNHVGKDMSGAKRFGILVPITVGNVDVFNIERMVWTIRELFDQHDFDNEKDCILLSGGLPINFAVGYILAKYDKVNLLIWDARYKSYKKRGMHL